MSWLLPLIYTTLLWSIWKASSLFTNIQRVRRLGLPLDVQFYDPNPVLLLLRVLYRRIIGSFASKLLARDGSKVEKLADAYFRVYPSSVELIINDPECAANVLSKRNDFIKLSEIAEKLNIFGPSVQTVEGEKWQRHRKITAPSFNERVSSSVWVEATQQAEEMLQSWKKESHDGTRKLAIDVNKLTIRVFSFAGIGIKYADAKDSQCLPPGHTMAYGDALALILDNIILLAMLPLHFFRFTILPRRFRKLGTATSEFRMYMEEILSHEQRKASREMDSHQGRQVHNLASALIQASESAKIDDHSQHAFQSLTDDEVFGNLFIYNVAGYTTTASAITYAIALLAAHPQWQDWLAEEIYRFDIGDSGALEYEDAFPKLKRCLAVMLETLRLYQPAIAIPKRVGPQPKTIYIHEKPYLIPPNTYVTIASQAIHCDPSNWGPDALTWRPSRWFRQVPSKPDANPSSNPYIQSGTEKNDIEELLIDPPKGTYMPWSDGPRVCPGRKFSQVEFVAVMATLFRRHRVRPKLSEGESIEGGQKRIMEMVERRDDMALTTQMAQPESVALIWEERLGKGTD